LQEEVPQPDFKVTLNADLESSKNGYDAEPGAQRYMQETVSSFTQKLERQLKQVKFLEQKLESCS